MQLRKAPGATGNKFEFNEQLGLEVTSLSPEAVVSLPPGTGERHLKQVLTGFAELMVRFGEVLRPRPGGDPPSGEDVRLPFGLLSGDCF